MTRQPNGSVLPWTTRTLLLGFLLPAGVVGFTEGWFVVWPVLELLIRTSGG